MSPADDAKCKVALDRYPSVGLPMVHVLVVTHFLGCVEIV